MKRLVIIVTITALLASCNEVVKSQEKDDIKTQEVTEKAEKEAPTKPEENLRHILENKAIHEWKGHLKNDFEKNETPDILNLKNLMYSSKAIYASMTGSGSAVYGLFKDPPTEPTGYTSLRVRL